MKIGFYSPYLHVLGGGERYILQMASLLSQDHIVDVFGEKKLQRKAERFFGLNLSKINFLSWETSKTKRILKTKEYDRFFYVTDGSLFISLAGKNYLIVQVPQKSMYDWNLAAQIKLFSWPNVLVYSQYVKNYIDKWWKVKSLIFPPAVNNKEFQTRPKENIILSVGRFFPLPHSKKQEVLVHAFKKMREDGLKEWKLVLAGGVDEQAKDYLNMIKEKAKSLPVDVRTNLSYSDLLDLYSRAKVYWHAAGFGQNLEKYPERAEHFGITTLEAMASGCVPLVYPAGGQREIVDDETDGFYWQSEQELCQKTLKLLENGSLWKMFSLKAKRKSQEYDINIFKKKLNDLII